MPDTTVAAGPVRRAATDVVACTVDGAVRGGVATLDLADTAEHAVSLKIS